jgi:hypothetical protein
MLIAARSSQDDGLADCASILDRVVCVRESGAHSAAGRESRFASLLISFLFMRRGAANSYLPGAVGGPFQKPGADVGLPLRAWPPPLLCR